MKKSLEFISLLKTTFQSNLEDIDIDKKSDDFFQKLEMYKEILLEWNSKINLTAITDDYEIIMKHFVDSLELVKYIDEGSNLIDVGTGAGFPGIVLAIYFEGRVKITLLDALNKRVNFLNEVIARLELKNVEVICGRAEEISKDEKYRGMYDFVVSRAVATLPILLEYEVPFAKVGGRCLIMKGNNVEEEIADSTNALKVLNSKITNKYEYSYKVNDEEYNRVILEVKKEKEIDSKYPRNNGQIKKKHL